MSQPIEETYVVVDADLDTADDDSAHCGCTYCNPHPGPFVALCGELGVWDGKLLGRPDNACPVCSEMYRRPCPICGH